MHQSDKWLQMTVRIRTQVNVSQSQLNTTRHSTRLKEKKNLTDDDVFKRFIAQINTLQTQIEILE